MAILMLLDVPGATTEQYDATNAIINTIEDVPTGLINHALVTTGDGIRVIDLWESAEAFQTFFEERKVGQAMAESGAPEPSGPPRILQVHNHFAGGGTEAGVAMIAEIDGFDAAKYDAMTSQMEAHAAMGPGHPATYHIAAVKENGDILVIDLWESAEAFGKFAEAAIAPAGEANDLPAFEPQFFPVHNTLKGNVLAGRTA